MIIPREDVVPLEVECRSTVREFYRESVRKEVRVGLMQ